MSERYRLLRLLGAGGMAEVYLGLSLGAEGFEKPVAIKRMLPQLASEGAVAQMFVAEGRVAMHLHHQNIVEVFDVGRNADGLFLVMELVNGWDLATVIEAARARGLTVPAPLSAYIAEQAVAGLRHAYRKTVDGKPLIAAHRDISPSNLLVTVDGEVKLCDFGIARVEANILSGAPRTNAGVFKGKIAYSAPEVLRGEAADRLSDQFSLGVVLHELLTGQHPFGLVDNLVAYHEVLRQAGPVELPQAPAALAELVQRLLAMDPTRRFPSIDEVGKALTAYTARSGTAVSAAEVSAFLEQLSLPPPPSELLNKPIPLTDVRPLSLDPTTIRNGPVPLVISQPVSITLERDSDWEPLSGRVMDVSGKVEERGKAPARAAAVPPPVVRANTAVGGARPAPVNHSVDEPLELADEGERWRQRTPETDPIPDPMLAGSPVRTAAGSVIRKLVTVVVVLVVLAAAATAAVIFSPQLGLFGVVRSLGVNKVVPGAPGYQPPMPAMLYLNSEPDGATVTIDGTVMGETPLVLENQYPSGAEVTVVLTKNGRHAWRSRFKGGQTVHLTGALPKK